MSDCNNKLVSEIINQKKQLIFKVEQTTNHVFPNEDYKYYLYIKNISGVQIDNIHIKINNPDAIIFNEHDNGEGYINIGTLRNGQVKFIYLKANAQKTGRHYVHFICYGDGTGLYYKTLNILCNHTHGSDELIHRIHIYDFTPYEDTYSMNVNNYSDQVTQLFKTQKLPFMAGEQPFHIQVKDNEITPKLFSNVEQDSFILQNEILKNTKEHVYQYLSRENFNKNGTESYEGQSLIEIIDQINEHSTLFKATFLQSGTNKLQTNLYEYEPNGFIYRFGLLNSEIYHYLGTLPTYSYMSDYLFRWAPNGQEPLNLYPKKIAMKWGDKKWSGRGWRVYRIATKDFFESDDFNPKIDKRWENIGHFKDEQSAKTCVERELYFDEVIRNQTKKSYDKYEYKIKESYYDTGVFFIHIPIDKIPSNFYLLNTKELEALIQRAKPFGAKPLIRYMVERTFDHHMSFIHYPIFKPYTEINMGDIEFIPYFIQSKKYAMVEKENQCGDTFEYYGLKPYGKTEIFEYPFEADMDIEYETMKPSIIKADIKQNLINKKKQQCNGNNECIKKARNKSYPDNSFNNEVEQYADLNSTTIDNNLKTLEGVKNILYQNNFEHIAFSIPSMGFKRYQLQEGENDEISIVQWMEGMKLRHFGCYIERLFEQNDDKISDYYALKTQQRKANTFKIPIRQKNTFDDNNKIGIGITDAHNKYHLFFLRYDSIYNKDYLEYSTLYNNNSKIKRATLGNSTSLIIKFLSIDGDYNNTLVIFFTENNNKLHYFHHIICPNLKEIFVFLSENLVNESEDINTFLTYTSQLYDKVTFETPQSDEYEKYETTNVFGGDNWTNLYRINKAENSYTYIHNKQNTDQEVNDIYLHFDNINIPDKAKIQSIKLKTIVDSSHMKQIYCNTSYQNNYIIPDANGNRIKLYSDNRECYHQTKNSQYYYHKKIEETNIEEKIQYYQKLINDNILFDEFLDFSEKIEIKNPYWIETSQFTDIPYDCNDIENIELVIEGFNHGSEINMLSQLLYEKDGSSIISKTIDNGYFFKKISLPFNNSFLIDWLRLRFRFESLNDVIEIFDYYINITFKNKKEYDLEFEETDYINNINKNIHYLDLYQQGVTAPEVNNGITVKLSFDDLSPGEQYKIYSNELEISYKIPDMNIIINKNKFYDTEKNNFIVVNGQTEDTYLSGTFYTDANFISQIYSDVNANNLGVELRDSVYQAFSLATDNITAIQIYPNGFKGVPDASLKIGIYENRGTTPGKLIKEVYANGWSKTNATLKNSNSIKYEINVDGLTPNKIYWFKLEVENPSENNYYLLKYTTTQRREYKLLLKENNNYINISGSLEFSIYSKDLTQSFSELPTTQDYLVNPYIKIGLHRGQGTIKNLSVKKKNKTIGNRVIFNGDF